MNSTSIFSKNLPANLILYPDDYYVNANYKNFIMDKHKHGCLEINYIVEGSCSYVIGSKKYIAKKKNLIIFNSELVHQLLFSSDVPCTVLGCSFYTEYVRPATIPLVDLLQSSPQMQKFAADFKDAFVINDAHSVQPLLREFVAECEGNNDFTYINILTSKLLVDIARLSQNDNASLIDHITKTKEFIQSSYFEIECIDDIADKVMLNKTYMQRIFKKQMGCTVWQYLTDVRMKAAANIIKYSDINIGDIDERVGINSRQNFYLLFRKMYGISPQDYRRQMREREKISKNQIPL